METHVPSASLHAFVEARTDLEALSRDSLVRIRLSASRGSHSRPQVLSNTAGSALCNNEETFSRSYLASASSIYYSKLKRYPQNFLWRVLENNKVLEIRSNDLRKCGNLKADATIVLQLLFPSAIRKGGVAWADDEGERVNVFVLTKTNDLFTLTIPNKSFYDVTCLEEESERWPTTFKPSSFTLSTPHRLVAGSPGQLVIALADGKLLNLTRKDGQDGPAWQERSFDDGHWGSSLRGLINWQGHNTIRYDGTVLDQNTAIAVEYSPSRTHLVTVCANHTLKIWNLTLDKIKNVFSMDLLGQRREPQDISKVMLDAGSPEILRVFEAEGAIIGDEYYAITYSPHGGGQFKIWAIRDADQGKLGVRFLHSDDTLRPPDPDSDPESKTVWKVTDFKVGGGVQGSSMELWLLMRSNKRYKTYRLTFDLVDLPAAWNEKWVLVATETLGLIQQPQPSGSDAQDASEIWLQLIFYPGRYTRSLLEIALSIYRSARKLTSPNDAKVSLEERLSLAIMAQVRSQSVRDDADRCTLFAQYQESIQQEWSLFYQEVQDLDRLRWQPLALTFDEQSGIPCSVFAGGCAFIRGCDGVEALARNAPTALQKAPESFEVPSIEDGSRRLPQLPEELSILIQGAAAFRRTFSATFQHECHKLLLSELWQDPVYSVADRIDNYYERCGFAEEVTDSAIDTLKETLAPLGSFEGLTSDHFLAIIERLPNSTEENGSSLMSTKLGHKVLVRGMQEVLNVHAQVLFDLLMVTVFIEVEAHEEVVSDANLNTSGVFIALSEQLKLYQLMQWLARSIWIRHEEARPSHSEHASSSSTVLESLFATAIRPQTLDRPSQSHGLTGTIRDLLVHVRGGDDASMTLDQVIVHIHCNLLRQGDTDLASDFAQFQPSTAWAVYIRGRLHLQIGELVEAAVCFNKAAYNLAAGQSFSDPNQQGDRRSSSEAGKAARAYHKASAGFLAVEEAEYFANGLAKYYTHIVHLFQAASCPSYAADFARLAIQFTPQSSELRSSLLQSLFASSLQTSDIESAYTSLSRLPWKDQSRLLSEFMKAILSLPNGPGQLLDLPWPAHFHAAIDAELADTRRSSATMTGGSASSANLNRDRRMKILAAWRLRLGDFRGAAAAMYPQLQALVTEQHKGKRASSGMARSKIGGSRNGNDGMMKGNLGVDEAYLSVMNLMACIDDSGDRERKEAWLLNDADGGKRRVVTIEDVRKGWQKELDRRSVVEGGRWGFGMVGDEMDLG
ncbi:MAG: hypothetical protein Q9192_004182 [Flavoplaca navasiana]